MFPNTPGLFRGGNDDNNNNSGEGNNNNARPVFTPFQSMINNSNDGNNTTKMIMITVTAYTFARQRGRSGGFFFSCFICGRGGLRSRYASLFDDPLDVRDDVFTVGILFHFRHVLANAR